ncbi:DUF1493 family protein [Erwinia pyrifoliae]|uniref:DUF1493 family protein n=1 Tax=Erwinia pyrifoliae TaxID=79967 RepID=UPI00220642B6|nr:DUF1493 family protein [Erwinia pyrifoliae]UWS30327.1 DUF1493 family protein [Erwinia pyrifoliae]
MKSDSNEQLREYILEHLPKVTTLFKQVVISDDEPLQETFESEDLAALVEDLSVEINVNCENFNMLRYFPWKTKSVFNRDPDNSSKAPLTLKMFIESAKAGYWLYY